MLTAEWAARVPTATTQKMAADAVNAFLRSNSAPEGAADFTWHWVAAATERGDVTRARVKLALPRLLRTILGVCLRSEDRNRAVVRITQGAVYIEPNWELRGGMVRIDALNERVPVVARVGWDSEHRIGVLFFADGGKLPTARLLMVAQ